MKLIDSPVYEATSTGHAPVGRAAMLSYDRRKVGPCLNSFVLPRIRWAVSGPTGSTGMHACVRATCIMKPNMIGPASWNVGDTGGTHSLMHQHMLLTVRCGHIPHIKQQEWEQLGQARAA